MRNPSRRYDGRGESSRRHLQLLPPPHPAKSSWATCPVLFECLIFSEENAQCAQSLDLPCGNMKCNTGHRPKCFPDPEPLRHEISGTQSLCAERHICLAQAFDF